MPKVIVNNFKKILLWSLVGLLFGSIATYSFFKMKDVIIGVGIEIKGIVDGQTVHDPKVDISGNAKNLKALTINDRLIGIGEDGSFKDTLLLSPGYNMVSVKGDDRFGKHIAHDYHVYFKDDSGPATALSQPIPLTPETDYARISN